MQLLLHMHESIFAASDETVRTVQVLYFRNRTWIIERSGQQCVLHSLSTDPSLPRERVGGAVGECLRWVTMSCSWSVGGLRDGRSPALGSGPGHCDLCLPLPTGSPPGCRFPPISPGNTECIRSRSVIEFHTCHSQLNCVFCEAHWKMYSW